MNWILPANDNVYDHNGAFNKWGFIDWVQNRKYNVGDIVYIYVTKLSQQIMYKTIVEKINLNKDLIVNDLHFWIDKNGYYKNINGKFVRLLLQEFIFDDNLKLECLLKHGLKVAPQSGLKINDELLYYIENELNNDNPHISSSNSITHSINEGKKYEVVLNRYERNPVARRKCIEYYGYNCFICGFNFEKTYGEVGKNYIQVHHKEQLSKIAKEHVVDYIKDLITVCPNCHAMLHKNVNGKTYTVEELKELISKLSKKK